MNRQALALLLLILFVLPAMQACVQPAPEKTFLPVPTGPRLLQAPASVQDSELSPGLSCIYIDKFYRNISQMPQPQDAAAKGRAGRPVLLLDKKYKKDELVFGSGEKKGVGMILTGYLRLAEPGTYRFQALSNDGIEMTLGGQLLFIDPDVHKDRLSPIGTVEVKTGGYYPLVLRYFQRKGTATLKLYWQPPGAAKLTIIPAKTYFHRLPE